MRAVGEVPDLCLVGEPTSANRLGDTIKIGRRGSVNIWLEVVGREGHVAYPHLADNPAPRLVAMLAELDALVLDEGTDWFQPSNLEITSIDVGNPTVNVIPAEARAKFNIRFNDLWTPETLEADIRARLEAVAQGARYTLTFQPTNALAFLTKPGRFVEFVSRAIEAETGRKPALSTTGGTSDARFIRNYAEVVEFGLVGQTMHAIDERVPVADLKALTGIYRKILDRYFA